MLHNLQNKRLILASKSPRRRQLMEGLELQFEVITHEVEEHFPSTLQAEQIPLYLAELKASAFKFELKTNEIVITADTVVWVNDHVLNKPADRDEAIKMIHELSGREHHVYTGVCISSLEKQVLFHDETKVTFTGLELHEIEYYVDRYGPYDKAGSYGAQDWIGLVGISKLDGSYFNVMGLPVHLLYQELKNF